MFKVSSRVRKDAPEVKFWWARRELAAEVGEVRVDYTVAAEGGEVRVDYRFAAGNCEGRYEEKSGAERFDYYRQAARHTFCLQ